MNCLGEELHMHPLVDNIHEVVWNVQYPQVDALTVNLPGAGGSVEHASLYCIHPFIESAYSGDYWNLVHLVQVQTDTQPYVTHSL